MNTLILKGTSTLIFRVWVAWRADSEMGISTQVYKGGILVPTAGERKQVWPEGEVEL